MFIDYLFPPVLLGGSAQSHLLLQGHTRPPETNSPCGEVPDNKSYRLFCLLVSLLSATFLTLMRMSHLQGCTPLWCRLVSFPDPQCGTHHCKSGVKTSATLYPHSPTSGACEPGNEATTLYTCVCVSSVQAVSADCSSGETGCPA